MLSRLNPQKQTWQRLRALLAGKLVFPEVTAGEAPDSQDAWSVTTTRGRRLQVHLEERRLHSVSRYALESAVAHAMVTQGRSSQERNGITVLVLHVPTLGKVLMTDLGEFMRPMIQPPNVVVLSAAGGGCAYLPQLEIHLQRPDDPTMRAERLPPAETIGEVLTVNAQWLLKILLFREAPLRWWAGPRPTSTSVTDLAEASQIPRPTVYKQIARFRQLGWVTSGHGEDQLLVNPGRMLRYWIDQMKYAHVERLALRPADPPMQWSRKHAVEIGADEVLQFLGSGWRELMIKGGMAITGWHAARLLGFPNMVGVESRVVFRYHDPNKTLLGSLGGLMPCDPRDAIVFAEPVSNPRAVLGGVVTNKEAHELPVVDPWQAALDVARDPNRGLEQANRIAEEILMQVAR